MLEILTVCTGNICRSPLAAQVLATRLGADDVAVRSAGTRARDGVEMTPEAAALAAARGVSPALSAAHRSHALTPADLRGVDLVLAMAREHRREIVELDPARVRTTFTAREFARLAADVTDDQVRQAADAAGSDPRERFRAALSAIAGRRGLVLPPAHPDDDDVVDPYRRSAATYERSAVELTPGMDAVVRVVELALSR